MKKITLYLSLLSSLAIVGTAQSVELMPAHASGFYSVGEAVAWTVTAKPGAVMPAGGFSYSLKLNNTIPLVEGKVDVSQGPARIEAKVNEPAMVYLEIAAAGKDEKPLAAGAAVSPTKLQPAAARPSDFDSFWAAKLKLLAGLPAEPVITPGESGRKDVEYATVRLNNIEGSHVYGQLARPAREGKFPAVLVMQWAGGPYPLQKSWVVDRAAQGWLVLNVEPHDVPGNMPQEFYDALPAMIKQYNTIYADDRDRCYFLRMYLGDYRAADYLTSRPDWDGKIFLAMGTSMGGMQSFAVAGLHPRITHMIVEVPAGADAQAALHHRHESYPNWDKSNPRVMQTAKYFDSVNFASHIHATSLVAMGFIDNVCAPTGIWTAYNQIAGPKEVVPLVYAAHNHQSTPEQLKSYEDRAAEWLEALARGQPLHLRLQPQPEKK
jgi:cephalosporin-C deacetylase-like acetyl esterase